MAPLLHEFTYQAMAVDLLDIEKGNQYKYEYEANSGKKGTKTALLDELDPLWPTLRHRHIAETIDWVLQEFNDFLRDNPAARMDKGGDVGDLASMSEAIRGMPKYREMVAKYSLHINISRSCMDQFKKRKLEEIADCEQDMVMHEDANGNKVKNLVPRITALLRDPDVTQGDKLRLLMLYIISQEGIKDSDRRAMMEIASVPVAKEVAIANMHFLGVKLTKTKAKKPHKRSKKSKKRQDDVSFDLSRYQPLLRTIMESACDGTLSTDEWPYVKEAPPPGEGSPVAKKMSVRKTAPKWSIRSDKKEATDAEGSSKPEYDSSRGRIIMFVAGGAALSEVRSAYEVSLRYNREVILGATHIIEPDQFVADLASLKPPASLGL